VGGHIGCCEQATFDRAVSLAQNVRYVGAVAAQVHVVAARLLDQRRRCPHADAPRVSRVGRCDDPVRPLERLLARQVPEVTRTPLQRRMRHVVDQLCADAVRAIMIALGNLPPLVSRACRS
jgi:hypothetical protein